MSDNSRISVVEAMRGSASVAVAIFHFSGQLTSEIPRFLAQYGWLGVDVFFVISGFVIPLSLYGRGYELRNFHSFMFRRLVRLEPPYLVSIALGILLWHASSMAPNFQGGEPSYSLPQIASHLLYAIPLTNYPWLNPVYWSLAYEFVFYIIVGISFSSLINRRIEWTVLAAASVAGAFFLWKSEVDVRILEFVVGILVMRHVVEERSQIAIRAWMAVSLALIFWFGGLKIGGAVFLAGMAILVFRKVRFGAWAFFLGGISYSLYLTHVPVGGRVINLGKRFGDSAIFELMLIAVAISMSVVFAMLFTYFIEGPATRAARKIALTSKSGVLKQEAV